MFRTKIPLVVREFLRQLTALLAIEPGEPWVVCEVSGVPPSQLPRREMLPVRRLDLPGKPTEMWELIPDSGEPAEGWVKIVGEGSPPAFIADARWYGSRRMSGAPEYSFNFAGVRRVRFPAFKQECYRLSNRISGPASISDLPAELQEQAALWIRRSEAAAEDLCKRVDQDTARRFSIHCSGARWEAQYEGGKFKGFSLRHAPRLEYLGLFLDAQPLVTSD